MMTNKQLPLWSDEKNLSVESAVNVRRDILHFRSYSTDSVGFFDRISIDREAAELIREDSNAFLFGLISDQSVKVEVAWMLPFRLMQRLGHFNIKRISVMELEDLTALFKQKPALHRFPAPMARNIKEASLNIVEKYEDRAENIWLGIADAKKILGRLKQFRGIGDKKANLGLSILVEDFDVSLEDISSIDVAFDVHVARVLYRTGLSKELKASETLSAARSIDNNYPGGLTAPLWLIGRQWCHARNPQCNECPIKQHCLKRY